MADCLFCGIVRGSVPSTGVLETEHCLAFRDINPAAPVHVLVVPKEHIGSVEDVGAGQLVPHLHFHVLGGRSLRWPPKGSDAGG